MTSQNKQILMIIIIIIVLITAFVAFYEPNDEDTKSKSSIQKSKNKDEAKNYTDLLLEFEAEKIVLLSLSANITPETFKKILVEYNTATYENEESDYLIKTISQLSEKYKIPRNKIASLIFGFKYDCDYENNDYNNQSTKIIQPLVDGPESEDYY